MAEDNNLRCFVAIMVSDEVVKEVARVQELLGKWKFTGKMTELENLHLTLKFLGEIDGEKIEDVKKKLMEIKVDGFEVKLSGIGIFSYQGNPRIVWVKIGEKGIFELQKKIDEKMKELGFTREERFMSHMTIARVKYVKDVLGFKKHLESINPRKISFEVKEFVLKESNLERTGPVYRDIERYVLL